MWIYRRGESRHPTRVLGVRTKQTKGEPCMFLQTYSNGVVTALLPTRSATLVRHITDRAATGKSHKLERACV